MGFCRGAGELIRDAPDSKYYENLEHVQYGYGNVKQRDYIIHLEDGYWLLDEQATNETWENYFRVWERTKAPSPEGLKNWEANH